MRRCRIATLAAGGHRAGPNTFAELDHRDETVPGRAIPFLRAGFWRRSERCERAPSTRGEGDADAGRRIVERMIDCRRNALEAIHFAPWYLPPAEILRQLSNGSVEGSDLLPT